MIYLGRSNPAARPQILERLSKWQPFLLFAVLTEEVGMACILFPSPIFGPIHSRRLGTSLGINLLPAEAKVCSFDCVYCECGFNKTTTPNASSLRGKKFEQLWKRNLFICRKQASFPMSLLLPVTENRRLTLILTSSLMTRLSLEIAIFPTQKSAS